MLCRLFFRALWSKRRQSTGHTWIKSRQVIVRVFCAGPLPWNGWPIYLPSPASQDPARIFCESGHSTYFWDSHQVGKRAAPRRSQKLTLDQLRQGPHSARWSTAAARLHTALVTKSMFAAQPVIYGCCAAIFTSAFRKNTARAWQRKASTG